MKKYLKKYALTVILVTAIILTYVTTITFAETKWATLCGFNYGSVDTTNDAYNCASDFNSAGYYSVVFKNVSAQSIYVDMPTESIFFFSGHGNAGVLECWDGNKSTFIYALGAAGSQNGINGNYYLNKISSLSKIKIAIFGGCYTANTSDWAGNLLEQALARGIQTSIGWKSTVDATIHSYWLKRFTYYLSCGYIAGTAANYANNDTSARYWFTGGTTNYQFNGNTFNKIV